MDKYLKKELKIIKEKIESGDLKGDDIAANFAIMNATKRYRKRKKKATEAILQLQQDMLDTF